MSYFPGAHDFQIHTLNFGTIEGGIVYRTTTQNVDSYNTSTSINTDAHNTATISYGDDGNESGFIARGNSDLVPAHDSSIDCHNDQGAEDRYAIVRSQGDKNHCPPRKDSETPGAGESERAVVRHKASLLDQAAPQMAQSSFIRESSSRHDKDIPLPVGNIRRRATKFLRRLFSSLM